MEVDPPDQDSDMECVDAAVAAAEKKMKEKKYKKAAAKATKAAFKPSRPAEALGKPPGIFQLVVSGLEEVVEEPAGFLDVSVP